MDESQELPKGLTYCPYEPSNLVGLFKYFKRQFYEFQKLLETMIKETIMFY
jgi:hypothetical protein